MQKEFWRLSLCRAVFNSDVQERELRFYYSGALTDGQIRSLFAGPVTDALAPSEWPLLPRSRFTGSMLTLQKTGLLATVHGLLWDALLLWTQPNSAEPPAPEAVVVGQHGAEPAAGPDQIVSANDEDQSLEVVPAALLHPDAGPAADIKDHLARSRKVKTDLRAWAKNRPTGQVVVLAVVMRC